MKRLLFLFIAVPLFGSTTPIQNLVVTGSSTLSGTIHQTGTMSIAGKLQLSSTNSSVLSTASDGTITPSSIVYVPNTTTVNGHALVGNITITGSDVAGVLLAANNLSDITTVSTARTNLGLGTAATNNKVVAGSTGVLDATDATTTNSRAPSGSAGGSLSGSYPNPSLSNTIVAGSAGDATHTTTITYSSEGRVTGTASNLIAPSGIGAAARGANSDITSISGLSTPLSVAQGGTGTATISGYIKGNGTSSFTSSATIPGSDVSGNISGNATNVTGIVGLANGGTGVTTSAAAINILLPTQTSNSGKILSTDGTNPSWIAVAGTGTVTTVSTGAGLTGGPVSTSGTISIDFTRANTWSGATSFSNAVNITGALTTATMSSLSASALVATDANKNLSNSTSGLSPSFTNLTLSGTLSAGATSVAALTANSLAMSVAQGNNLNDQLVVRNLTSGTAAGTSIEVGNNAVTQGLRLSYYSSAHSTLPSYAELSNVTAGPLLFSTTNVERMRILSGGNLLINATTDDGTGAKLQVNGNVSVNGSVLAGSGGLVQGGFGAGFSGSQTGINLVSNDNASGTAFAVFRDAGTTSIGSITRVGASAAVVFNTTSDARLKVNVRDFTSSGAIIDGLRPRLFDWKDGSGNDAIGFIAQEENAVDPALARIGAVTVGDDDPDTIHKQWKRSDSALIVILVAELKSLRARVAELEATQAK